MRALPLHIEMEAWRPLDLFHQHLKDSIRFDALPLGEQFFHASVERTPVCDAVRLRARPN
jgi:hypothetical protein